SIEKLPKKRKEFLRIVFLILVSYNFFFSLKKYLFIDWNDYPYSEIFNSSLIISEYTKKFGITNLYIDGEKAGGLGLSFLIILEKLGSKIDFTANAKRNIKIHTNSDYCSRNEKVTHVKGSRFCITVY
ncbi:MAG: hypothetical protein L6Q54_15805, partial [Leptospiraceae bacterium]|nr:hypothetical protein [Leptospiraceae bacterium]